jgi:hypothetical protein
MTQQILAQQLDESRPARLGQAPGRRSRRQTRRAGMASGRCGRGRANGRRNRHRHWWTLGAMCFVLFMTTLDKTMRVDAPDRTGPRGDHRNG